MVKPGIPQVIVPGRNIPQVYVERALNLVRKGPVKLTDQFGFKEQMENKIGGMPEVLMLGTTNVGKSSLITALLNPRGSPKAAPGKPRDYPNISKRQGFTKTLSFYTIGKSLRLVDSPGYGFKSSLAQGSVVTDYLETHAKNLVRAYVLVQAAKGLGVADVQVLTLLIQMGVPFNLVLTKADVLGSSAAVDAQSMLLYQQLEDLSSQTRSIPDDLYITSTNPKKWPNLGISELRASIYRASGLSEAHDLMR